MTHALRTTRRAYRIDLSQFMAFVGLQKPEEFPGVRRPHVIAWRKDLEARKLAPATIRRKLSALSDLFNHLCESNAILHNPVSGVDRPGEGANEGKTPAISDAEARMLLAAPDQTALKGRRDRMFLAVLLYPDSGGRNFVRERRWLPPWDSHAHSSGEAVKNPLHSSSPGSDGAYR